MTDNAVIHPRGSKLTLPMVWTGDDGVAEDLSGLTLTPFEIEPTALAADVTVTITDAVNGAFTVTVPWTVRWPDGLGPLVSLRVQASDGRPFSWAIPVVLE